jgi:hypothetical protein
LIPVIEDTPGIAVALQRLKPFFPSRRPELPAHSYRKMDPKLYIRQVFPQEKFRQIKNNNRHKE